MGQIEGEAGRGQVRKSTRGQEGAGDGKSDDHSADPRGRHCMDLAFARKIDGPKMEAGPANGRAERPGERESNQEQQ